MDLLWNGHPVTDYFLKDVLSKRTYLCMEWCSTALKHPLRREIQPGDGRIRYWTFISEQAKYLRVVTLADGVTIHNAFFDRGFKP